MFAPFAHARLLLAKSFGSLRGTTQPIDGLCLLTEPRALAVLAAGNVSLHDPAQLALLSSCQKWTRAQASALSPHAAVLRPAGSQLVPQPPGPPQHAAPPVLLSILAVPCRRRLVLFLWRDGQEHIATFFTLHGKLARPHAIVHAGTTPVPSSILYPAPPAESLVRPPYLLSLLQSSQTSTSLLIHALPTLSHLQTLPLPAPTHPLPPESASPSAPNTASPGKKQTLEPPFNPRTLPPRPLIAAGPTPAGPIFIVGSHWNPTDNTTQYHLDALLLKPWPGQIQQLIEIGEYEEALGLMDCLDQTHLPAKAELKKKLDGLRAVVEFGRHKYDAAVDEFIRLSTHPAKVLALYPREISGSLGRDREEWEEMFGGRSAESVRCSPLVSSQPHPPQISRAGSDIGSNLPPTGDDDRRSIMSGPSAAPAKSAKPGDQKTLPDEDAQFRASVEVLIRYLTDRRQQVNRALLALPETPEEASGPPWTPERIGELEDRPIAEIGARQTLVNVAKVIDTALFRSYLVLRPTMLGPLCRLPNWCEVELVEGLLMDAKRYHELLDLYHGKGQHAKALKLLKKMAMNEDDVETQIEPTVRYLQKLGSAHIDVILEGAKWVFTVCEDNEGSEGDGGGMGLTKAALEIFVADLSAVDSLPKPRVVAFLDQLRSRTPLRLYLEFLVQALRLQEPAFHEKLVQVYLLEITRLRGMGLLESAREMYAKLLAHLEESDSYSASWVLGRLPGEGMWEARAAALGKMGSDEPALRIYVDRLADLSKAEHYCLRTYEKAGGAASDGGVFLCLIRICLASSPPHQEAPTQQQPAEPGAAEQDDDEEEGLESVGHRLSTTQLLEAGLRLINEHGHKVAQTAEMLGLVPPLVSLATLDGFFAAALRRRAADFHRQTFAKHVLRARLATLSVARDVFAGRRVKVDLKRLCVGCGKRLGTSVIAVHPPYGEVTHYQCQDRFNSPHLRRLPIGRRERRDRTATLGVYSLQEPDLTSSRKMAGSADGVAKAADNGRATNAPDRSDQDEQVRAATVLQTRFRKYQRQREDGGLNLTASTRWHEAIKEQNFKTARRHSTQGGRSDSHSRWKRAGVFTSGLVDSGPTSPHREADPLLKSPSTRPKKTMDTTYWLEMVDHKHRYGSNLKAYHIYWNTQYEGDQNFFYWLDHGEGRELDLQDSPRERLDSERITYLTAEQRRNYLIKTVDGKLVWAKDSRPVDTARGRHKDLGNGHGIVDATPEEFEAAKARGEIASSDSDSSMSSSASSILSRDAHHYAQATPQKSGVVAKLKSHVDPKAIMDNLLRKTLNANTWIFVADQSGNMYVGIKQTGKFQHSSFLAGSHVIAAGLLKVDQGQLTSLSPLSGHYRAGSDQFKTFVKILEHEWGCDMSRVSISKALFMIGALEKYAHFSKKKAEMKAMMKKLWKKHNDQDPEALAAEKEKNEDRPAQVAAEHASHQENWQETVRVNRLARVAGEEERERIKKQQGALKDGRLRNSVVLPSLPHEGKKKEDMTDDERVERGAALVARAMARQRKC
ncbi:hypothetical protein PtA15_1A207 [Puccinia triticina]|nr:uncharacterized protein PtA15_1A207 [Puccinia triticina]WAQ80869.1 hypothetical protein PtA15_1A207 [Puccinia triticina]